MTGMILLSSNAFTSTEKFEFYTITNDVKDLAFKIESKEINETLRSKKIISAKEAVYANAYWYKGEYKVELQGAKLSGEMKALITQAYTQKAYFVWGNSFEKWIDGYKIKTSSSKQLVYDDPSGLLEKSEILVNRSKNKIVINEKKPIGTIRTSINLEYPKWSKKFPVFKKSSRVAYEGSRVLRTNIELDYKLTKSKKYFPSLVKIKSTQSVTFESSSSIDRNINEEFIYTNYRINDGIAKNKI